MAPSSTMRALVCRKLGDPTQPFSDTSPIYVAQDYSRPELSSPTCVRVKVLASSVNFATGLTIEGKYQERPPLPYVPGEDFTGTVLEVGDRVSRFKAGDAVCGVVSTGAYAEELVADESKV
jgi:NADPH2:quinone reductase